MLRHFLSILAVSAAVTASAAATAMPSGVAARVVAVQESRVADLVVLGAGFDAGLRRGMVFRVARGGVEVGELLLVELRQSCSAALIVSLAPRQSIAVGDSVAVKILKS